jgi:hypothetical protein
LEYLGASASNDAVRLIPFKASVSASYVLEFGTNYIRVWKNGALVEVDTDVPLDISTPYTYTDTELGDVKFTSSVDVMWFVHPSHSILRLSRTSDTSWSMEEEGFDYPPLLDENETETKIYPSALTGSVTLTSSVDFFNSGHVGAYMAFSAVRTTEDIAAGGTNNTATISGALAASGKSSEIYVSSSNWEVSTTGTWTGRLILQRSTDGGSVWEDYLVIGDTTGRAASNFSTSSSTEEPVNTRLRLRFTRATGTLNYQVKTDDPWKTLVKITAHASATSVTATVLDEFQDKPGDYTEWATSTSYVVGDKVKLTESLVIDSPTNNDLAAEIDANPRGMTFDGTYYWTIASTGAVDKVDNTYSNAAGWSASATMGGSTGAVDIAHDGTYVYVLSYTDVFGGRSLLLVCG